MITSAASTGIVNAEVAVRFWVSVTVTEKLAGVAFGGVPVSRPPDVSVNHAGREEAVQIYGADPPDATNWRE